MMNRLISEIIAYGKPAKVVTDESNQTCISKLYSDLGDEKDITWYLGNNILTAHEDAVGYWKD